MKAMNPKFDSKPDIWRLGGSQRVQVEKYIVNIERVSTRWLHPVWIFSCCGGEKLVNLRLQSIAVAQARAWKVNYAGMASIGPFIRLSLYIDVLFRTNLIHTFLSQIHLLDAGGPYRDSIDAIVRELQSPVCLARINFVAI